MMDAGMADVESLRKVSLFESVGEKDMLALAALAERRSYGKQQEILGQEETADGIFVIVEGSTRSVRRSPEGGEVTMATLGAGEIFGLPSITPEVRTRSALQAMADGTAVYRFSRRHFRQFVASHPEVALRVLDSVDRQFALLSDRFEEMALYPVRVRLARELVRGVEASGTSYVTTTHDQLASYIGTGQIEVTRALRYFREHGWVASRHRRHGFTVQNIEALAAYASENADVSA